MITEKGPGQPAPPGKPERQDGQGGQRGQEGPASGVASGRAVRRVARNSVAPFAENLVGRAVAIVLAVVMARTLGAGGTGLYAVAVNLWLYATIVADFGLGTWLTREVA